METEYLWWRDLSQKAGWSRISYLRWQWKNRAPLFRPSIFLSSNPDICLICKTATSTKRYSSVITALILVWFLYWTTIYGLFFEWIFDNKRNFCKMENRVILLIFKTRKLESLPYTCSQGRDFF